MTTEDQDERGLGLYLGLGVALGAGIGVKPYTVSSLPSDSKGAPHYFSTYSEIGGTYYGYFGGMQYASEVPADAVLNGPQWQPLSGDPPLSPSQMERSRRTGG